MVDFVERSLEECNRRRATGKYSSRLLQEWRKAARNSSRWTCSQQQRPTSALTCHVTSKHYVQLAHFGLDMIDLTKCRAEGIESNGVEINKPAQFTLHLVDCTGHPHEGLPRHCG